MAGPPKPFLIDPTVPRPAPRFPLKPTPFTYEKPISQIPEVSLIFDSSTNSSSSSSRSTPKSQKSGGESPPPQGNISGASVTPADGPKPAMMSFEIHVLYDLLKRQEDAMQRLEKKLEIVAGGQEEQKKMLESAMEVIMSKLEVKRAEQGVQTDGDKENVVKKNCDKRSVEVQTEFGVPAVESSRSSSSNSSLSIPGSPGRDDRRLGPGMSAKFPVNDYDKAEDLSTILKDLQLPTIAENSIFSEVSVKSIPLQDFNESLSESELGSPRVGASASAYASDEDEDEVVKPTTTFYRNVIGNVNKMLDNSKREVTLFESTDTTIYGMSSTNLSFATKQYLQKYGLVKHKSSPGGHRAPPPPPTNPAGNRIFSDDELPRNQAGNNNRILDVTAIRNQAKFY